MHKATLNREAVAVLRKAFKEMNLKKSHKTIDVSEAETSGRRKSLEASPTPEMSEAETAQLAQIRAEHERVTSEAAETILALEAQIESLRADRDEALAAAAAERVSLTGYLIALGQ